MPKGGLVSPRPEEVHGGDQIRRVFHGGGQDRLTGPQNRLSEEILVELPLAFPGIGGGRYAEHLLNRLRVREAPALDVGIGAADRAVGE